MYIESGRALREAKRSWFNNRNFAYGHNTEAAEIQWCVRIFHTLISTCRVSVVSPNELERRLT